MKSQTNIFFQETALEETNLQIILELFLQIQTHYLKTSKNIRSNFMNKIYIHSIE